MSQESSINQMSKFGISEKDIFSKKGGTLALLILFVVGLLVILNVNAILAWATSLLHLIVVLAAIAGILFLAFNKRIRLIVGMGYMFVIQKIIGIFIKIDPILILEDTLSDMRKRISDMDESIDKLNGVRLSIKEKLQAKKDDFEKQMKLAQAAKNKGEMDLATVHNRHAVRIEKLIKSYDNLRINSDKWYEVMNKMGKIAKMVLMDTENEVEAKKEEYKIVKLSHKAFKSALSVINGDPDKLALYKQAFEYVNDDIMAKIGEMDRFLNSSEGFLKQIDLDNDVVNIQGDELLAKYNEMGIDAMFTSFEKTSLDKLDVDGNGVKKSKITYAPTSMASNVETKRGKYF